MSWEKMFRTSGSTYYFNEEEGLWRRNNNISERRYIGSIDGTENRLISEDENRTVGDLIALQICIGVIPGYVPHFVVGNNPLGIVCTEDDIEEIANDRLILASKVLIPVRYHVGHPIEEVFR
jgi:hypothetical protein